MTEMKLLATFRLAAFAQIDFKNATVYIKDGSTPANSLEVTIGEGNLTFSEKRNMEYTLNRGVLDEVREGDQVPMDIRLDAVWEYLTSGSATGATPTIRDVLKKTGAAAAWVSSDSDACRPYAVDIELRYVPSCQPGDTEVITFPDFRFESIDGDTRAGTLSITGKCNAVAPTISRFTTTT